QEWGAANVHLEKWGSFGRGWSMSRFSAHMTSPVYAPLGGVPKAWCAGTRGPVSGEVVYAPLVPEDEPARRLDIEKLTSRIQHFAEAYRGSRHGRVVLMTALRERELPEEEESRRYDDSKLAELATAPAPFPPPALEWGATKLPEDPKKRAQLIES